MIMVTLSIGSNDAGRAGGLFILVNAAATYDDIIVHMLVFSSVYVSVTQLPVLDSTAMCTQHNAALNDTIFKSHSENKNEKVVNWI